MADGMNAEQDQLYYDFRSMAADASAVEVDDWYFVRYFKYDCGELHIQCQDDGGGFEIRLNGICSAILAGMLSWDNETLSFVVEDADGCNHTIRFMAVIPLERKGFS